MWKCVVEMWKIQRAHFGTEYLCKLNRVLQKPTKFMFLLKIQFKTVSSIHQYEVLNSFLQYFLSIHLHIVSLITASLKRIWEECTTIKEPQLDCSKLQKECSFKNSFCRCFPQSCYLYYLSTRNKFDRAKWWRQTTVSEPNLCGPKRTRSRWNTIYALSKSIRWLKNKKN